MSDTPLSDLIAQHASMNDARSYTRVVEVFRQSKLGVIATGAPDRTVGDVTSTAEKPLQVGMTQTRDDRRMILVFADPPAFIRRFGRRFNAEMGGEAVLRTAASDPACDGVLVNSATSESALILERRTIISALESRPASGVADRKSWWKFW
jgi:hypothetical protein